MNLQSKMNQIDELDSETKTLKKDEDSGDDEGFGRSGEQIDLG